MKATFCEECSLQTGCHAYGDLSGEEVEVTPGTAQMAAWTVFLGFGSAGDYGEGPQSSMDF